MPSSPRKVAFRVLVLGLVCAFVVATAGPTGVLLSMLPVYWKDDKTQVRSSGGGMTLDCLTRMSVAGSVTTRAYNARDQNVLYAPGVWRSAKDRNMVRTPKIRRRYVTPYHGRWPVEELAA